MTDEPLSARASLGRGAHQDAPRWLARTGHLTSTVPPLLHLPPELTLVETDLWRELRGLTGSILSRRAGQMRVNRPELVEAHGRSTRSSAG
jgi:hypothetical protein